MKIETKVARLEDALTAPKGKLKDNQESSNDRVHWKITPLTVTIRPEVVSSFKRLGHKLRSKIWKKLGKEKEFNPSELITYQVHVNACAVLKFAKDPTLYQDHKAYVLITKRGPCVWNGNHRAVAALLAKRKFKALYLDLTK